MNRPYFRALITVALFLGAAARSPMLGQTGGPPDTTVQFRDSGVIGGVSASPVVEYPMQCRGETAFINMMDPPDFRVSRLYAVNASGEAHRYTAESINDLSDISVRSYYPTDRGVLMLIEATRSSEKKQMTTVMPDNSHRTEMRYAGVRSYFLARFDADGAYRGSVALDDHIKVNRVAMFNSGVFLAIGIEQSTNKLRLFLLNSDGSILRYLESSREMTDFAKAESKDIAGLPADFGIVPATELVPFRDSILVVSQGSRVPVLEVRASGAIRPVRLHLPPGLVVHGLIASESRWYVRTSAMGNRIDAKQVALYEFDPENGNLLARFIADGASVDDIVCADQGVFIGLRPTAGRQLTRVVGSFDH